MTDGSELEQMVASSPYGTTFIAPAMTSDGYSWSFLIHDSIEIIESIAALTDDSGSVDACSEVKCAVLGVPGTDSSEVTVVVFLFKFVTDPPEVYIAFMNPMDRYVGELLRDLSRQDRLVVEFYDYERIMGLSCNNGLREKLSQMLVSLEGLSPFDTEAFDLAIDTLLAEQTDHLLLFEQLYGRMLD